MRKTFQQNAFFEGKMFGGSPVKWLSEEAVFRERREKRIAGYAFFDVVENNPIQIQLSIAYPVPETYAEKVAFRTSWTKMLHDRRSVQRIAQVLSSALQQYRLTRASFRVDKLFRYLLIHASRTKDRMHMFFVSISDGFCWQKFLTHTLPHSLI